jgi:hypothetical protein
MLYRSITTNITTDPDSFQWINVRYNDKIRVQALRAINTELQMGAVKHSLNAIRDTEW